MKVVMTLLVRDEQDIIGQNIEYHLRRGVDYIVATDNGSVDGTVDILRVFERAKVLNLILEHSDDYSQSKWVTRMAHDAANRFGADWILHSDADEFWWPSSATFQETFATVDEIFFGALVERTNFVPRACETGHPLRRMTIRETVSRNAVGAPLPPKVFHRASAQVRVSQGNHSIEEPAGARLTNCPAIEILHYPLRSYRQFENKIVKGGAAYRRNAELPGHVGYTWRNLYEKYEMGLLRDYYDQQVLSEAAIEEGLTKGSLVQDLRLIDYLEGEGLL